MHPSSEWRPLYPFASHALQIQEHRYHYLDEGQGEVLLCVHGNPTWSFYWRHLVAALRSGYRVLAVDHLGCGQSDKPRHYDYCLSRHVDNLVQLVDRLGLAQVTLLAHDWGGAIGLGAALARPDRFARLILFNTAAFRAQRMPWRIRACRTPLVGRVMIQGFNAFARAALRMAVNHPEKLTPAVRRGLLAPYDSWSNRQAIYRFVADIPMSPRHPSYLALAAIESALPRLADRPTMFVWGMRDWCFTPWFLERFLEFFPAAEVHRLEDAGHYVVEDAPDRVTALVSDFLRRHPLSQDLAARSAAP